MFVHLGEDVSIRLKDIIGIFQYDSSHFNTDNRNFLRLAKEDGFVIRISDEEPKSYIVAEIDHKARIYLSPISVKTLIKRSNSRMG